VDYYDDARARARRRKSPWNLLLIPLVALPLAGLWWSFVFILTQLHSWIYPGESLALARGLGSVLTRVAPVFAALPLSMVVGNMLVFLVPPARRVLAKEAASVPGTDLRSSQRGLLRMSRFLVPFGLGLAAIGALLRWSY
jgi:hypothetical protein